MEDKLNATALRITELIEHKTGGSRVMFAAKIGISKQQLTNVLAGKSIGLALIEKLLRAFPDLNARWLIFGEGNMLEVVEPHFGGKYETLLAFEKYLPYMTEAEVAQLTNGKNDWSAQDIARWEELRAYRTTTINARFAAAYAKQGMTFQNNEI